MSFFNKRKSSGVFIPSGKGYVEYIGDIGNGSIVSVANSLGYHIDQLHSEYFSNYVKPKIYSIELEVFTRKIAFVITDANVTYITEKDINKYLKNFSATKVFNTLKTEDILTSAVENGSFSVEFLSKVLNLKDISKNGMFYAEKIKTYLYFTNGILTNFQMDDGYMPYSRHLQEVNQTIFKWISELAYKYWPKDDFKAKREINIQCDAWSRIPEAFGNQFINLHRTENGGANLHMILVCHYDYPINLSQFDEINHGRYKVEIEDSDIGIKIITMGNFRYYFDKSDEEDLLYFDRLS
ncbi:hypothetical protein J2X97_000790 [Epilithonimonas hungarica]|uniref:hypothetical protein n=1 Tax=Epilithonimonas hungarica TaxID=454006 RepID=UPI0027850E88|nr:hypothetical protein [Epilithonimonas hungarica]MDP9955153.1 hypothetical protein [Epilithonimonas hungarica]